MVRSTSVRLFAVVVAAGSLLVVAAGPAASTVPKVACPKATFKTNLTAKTSTSVMTGCTNPAVSGGGGTVVAHFPTLTNITAKITWKGTGTTSYKVTEGPGPKTNTCKTTNGKKDGLILSVGKFTGGTGKAGTALKGLLYKEALCVTPTDATYLEPGTKITFG
jgi:hypothetical protein